MNAITKFKTQKKIKRLLRERDNASAKIKDLISNLDNYGGECHCERDKGTADFIVSSNSPSWWTISIMTYCLECGGNVV